MKMFASGFELLTFIRYMDELHEIYISGHYNDVINIHYKEKLR